MSRWLVVCAALWATGAAAGPALQIEEAWVRVLPPGQNSTAAYMSLHNSGDAALVVTAATAAIASTAEFHTTREVDGMVRMQQLKTLDLAPGARLALAPGGAHLMLLGLRRMPVAGEQVTLCLQLAMAEEVCTVATARKTAPAADDSHAHHH